MNLPIFIFTIIAVLIADFPDILNKEKDKQFKKKKETIVFLVLFSFMVLCIFLYFVINT